ncbi:MAG: ArsA family ATPase [Thermodesulfobacteriota bacterium]
MSTRIILFAGKGGVGKTSVAAATGIRAAKLGYRTLIMSLDTAHSLADVFDLDWGLMDKKRGKVVALGKNLWIQEVDVQEEIERNWGEVHKYVSTLFNVSGLDEVLAEELAILPGMEEVSCLLYINQYVKDKSYDLMVLDCAPTGESLRFISVPTTLEWYMKKIFTLERNLLRLARPFFKSLSSIPLPEDSYFRSLERLYGRLSGVDRILTDGRITTVRLVTNPEKIVIKETQRAFMYFCLYGLWIDAVIMNRVLPDQVSDGYFSGWKEAQGKYISSAEEYFSPVPIWQVELFPNEILGRKDLSRLAETIYGRKDPTRIFYREKPYQFTKKAGRLVLTVKLPFTSKEDLDLSRSYDELVIRVGGFKRHVPMPRSVGSAEPTQARIEGNTLTIYFGGEDGREKKSCSPAG